MSPNSLHFSPKTCPHECLWQQLLLDQSFCWEAQCKARGQRQRCHGCGNRPQVPSWQEPQCPTSQGCFCHFLNAVNEMISLWRRTPTLPWSQSARWRLCDLRAQLCGCQRQPWTMPPCHASSFFSHPLHPTPARLWPCPSPVQNHQRLALAGWPHWWKHCPEHQKSQVQFLVRTHN